MAVSRGEFEGRVRLPALQTSPRSSDPVSVGHMFAEPGFEAGEFKFLCAHGNPLVQEFWVGEFAAGTRAEVLA